MTTKTNYFAHDNEYKARMAKGFPGWADQPTLDKNVRTLESEFSEHGTLLDSMSGRRVLEVGCGAGDLSIWLAQQGFDVHGIDISPTAIGWAKQKVDAQQLTIGFEVGSVVDLGSHPDSQFDLVLDGHCLHCIIGEDRKTMLANARRVLKPNGLLFVKTMCGDLWSPHISVSDSLRKKFDRSSRCLMAKAGFATRYIGLPEDILCELKSAGFDVLAWKVQPATEVDCLDELRAWCRRPH